MIRHSLAALLALLPIACTAQSTSRSSAGAESDAAPASAPPQPAARITYSQCHVDGPYIALTFDDGPHGTHTPRLLDMLKQRGAKATFFVIGRCVAEYPEITKRIVAEGHELASHSWSHPLLSKMSDDSVREQLQKTHDVIQQTSGVAPKLMRPPYGGFTERQRRWANDIWGYKVILWDVDPLDWKHRSAGRVQSEILQRTVPGSIVLAHDIHKSTVDAMPGTLDGLAEKGFKFVTVSELLAMDRPRPKAPSTPPAATKRQAPEAQPDKPARRPEPGHSPAPEPTTAASTVLPETSPAPERPASSPAAATSTQPRGR